MTPTTILDLIRRLHPSPAWQSAPISVSDERAFDANGNFWRALSTEQWRSLRDYLHDGCPKDKMPVIRYKFIELGADAYLQYATIHNISKRREEERKAARKAEHLLQAMPGCDGDHEAVEMRSAPPADIATAIEANLARLESITGRKMRRAKERI